MKNILVTGSQGYIGAVLVPKLLDLGHKVCGLDTDLYRDADCGSPPTNIPILATDIRDVRIDQLAEFDIVIHLAALSNDPLGNLDPQLTYDINHRASVDLARKAAQAGVKRFLFSSSCSCYGAAGNELLSEEADFNPITPYGKSKVLADREISQLANDSFSPTFLRNATAYGFSPRLRLDLVVNDFAASAYLDKRIYIKSDGTPWRPLVHVSDICQAFIKIMNASRDAVHNQAFNVGDSRENYRVSDLAEIVRSALPECAVEYDPNGGPDKRCYRVSCDKLKRHIPNFEIEWTVEKGVEELLDAFRRFDLKQDAVAGKRYLRLAGLERRMQERVVLEDLRPAS